MILEIGLIVCVTAVSLLFLDEFTHIYKKIIAIPGVVLLVPLLFASSVVERYANIWEWLGWLSQSEIQALVSDMASGLPFQLGSLPLIKVMFLCLLTFMPVLIIWGISRYRGRYTLPRMVYGLSLVTWIIAIFLVI